MSKYEEDEEFVIAAVLDPRFKLTWCRSEAMREQHISNVKAKMNPVEKNSEEELKSPPRKVHKPSGSLFSFLPQAANRQRHTSGCVNELDLYMSEDDENPDCDIMDY